MWQACGNLFLSYCNCKLLSCFPSKMSRVRSPSPALIINQSLRKVFWKIKRLFHRNLPQGTILENPQKSRGFRFDLNRSVASLWRVSVVRYGDVDPRALLCGIDSGNHFAPAMAGSSSGTLMSQLASFATSCRTRASYEEDLK